MKLLTLFLLSFLTLGSKSGPQLGPAFSENNPRACAERQDFHRRYYRTQVQALEGTKIGSRLHYRITETLRGEQEANVRDEYWEIIAVDRAAKKITITRSADASEKSVKQTEVIDWKMAGKPQTILSKDCFFEQAYFAEYASGKVTIAKKSYSTLIRKQKDFGSAAFEESYSAGVPLGRVRERLRLTYSDGSVSLRSLELISFTVPH